MKSRASPSPPGTGPSTDAAGAGVRAGLASASLIIALPGLMNGFYKEQLFSLSEFFFWISDSLQFIVIPAACLVYLHLRENIGPSGYGLGRPADSNDWWQLIPITAGVTVILYVAYNFVSQAAWLLSSAPPPEFTYHSTMPEGAMRLPVALYFALTAGLTEEIAFRGLPWAAMRTLAWKQGLKTAVYVLLTSSLFAAIHWENGTPELLATFSFGVVSAGFYLKLRSLWPLVAAHVLLDLMTYW